MRRIRGQKIAMHGVSDSGCVAKIVGYVGFQIKNGCNNWVLLYLERETLLLNQSYR